MKDKLLNFAEQMLSKDQMKKVKGGNTTISTWPDGSGYTVCEQDFEHRRTVCMPFRNGGNQQNLPISRTYWW